MSPIARSPIYSDFYPKDWHRFTTVNPQRSELLGLGVTKFRRDIFRWASRYRIAKSFRGLVFAPEAGIHPGTVQMLDEITGVFLAYTAYEQFCTRVLLLKMNEDTDLRLLEVSCEPALVLAKIRACDPDQTYAKFLAESLDEKTATRMKRFIAGESCNIAFFGKAIRHVVAHGALSPSSGTTDKVQPVQQPAFQIATLVRNFLLPLMDQEFSNRVIQKLPSRASVG